MRADSAASSSGSGETQPGGVGVASAGVVSTVLSGGSSGLLGQVREDGRVGVAAAHDDGAVCRRVREQVGVPSPGGGHPGLEEDDLVGVVQQQR